VSSTLAAVLQHPAIFRMGDVTLQAPQTLSTGFTALDCELPGGGWPRSKLTEILCDHVGVGELSLLLPAHKEDTSAQTLGEMIWILPTHNTASSRAPPVPLCIPYAPALAQRGINLDRLTLVDTTSAADALWAAEQSLMSGCARIVVMWLTQHPNDLALRRLSLAARQSDGACILMRPLDAEKRPSPAELRIALRPLAYGAIDLTFIKRRALAQSKSIQLRPQTLACLAPHRMPRRIGQTTGSPSLANSAWLRPIVDPTTGTSDPINIRQRSFTMDR
jgi:protein ImuA